MENMQLELIRRDYYDPKAAIILKQHKLELWPGYVTSIRQHESQILLCCEVSHKILRTDTVLDQIEEVHKRSGGAGFDWGRGGSPLMDMVPPSTQTPIKALARWGVVIGDSDNVLLYSFLNCH